LKQEYRRAVSMISDEWIDNQIIFLNSRLGIYRPEPAENFFFEPTGGFYGFIAQGRIEPLNEAMRMLANHLLSISVPIIEDWEGSTDFLTTHDHDYSIDGADPGFITYDGPNRSRIKIGFINKHSPYVMGAILAHELTHHFLFNKNIGYPEIIENERFTDFGTVFLGLGKLTLNGYEPISWTVGQGEKKVKYTYKIGYLSQNEMAAIMRKICLFRKIPISTTMNNLTEKSSRMLIKEFYETIKINRYETKKGNIINFFRKLFSTKSETDNDHGIDLSKKHYGEFITIACRTCKRKLKIPVVNSKLKIKCPHCYDKFMVCPKQ
jgi:hypothetical protein